MPPESRAQATAPRVRRRLLAACVVAGWGVTALVGSADPRRPKAPATLAVGFAPDPSVAASTRTWSYPIRVVDGTVFVQKPRLVTHERAVQTPRRLGRFALELYVGRELLERVRFDIPLLDEAPRKKGSAVAPDFAKHLNVLVHADLPDLDRATYVLFVDRATGATQRAFWPPVDDFVAVAVSPSALVSAASSLAASSSSGPPARPPPGPSASPR